jgi:hypothetical protein
MIAVILRDCPNVEMVGIYDCPLIHFGDVLCLLDLIHEVNKTRKQAGCPQITAFDFYPRYNHGTPFRSDGSATYGLTWGPHPLDGVQRGFFNIILKAFMKAKKMNLSLIFEKDQAFCGYLGQVPFSPLAVPIFLDALHRYMDVRDEKSKKMVIYDLVKHVRLGLERDMDLDLQRGYLRTLGRNLVFCSSCGYETLQEFFSASSCRSQPHLRLCTGCTLQRWLDEEEDHLKGYKKQVLNTLYPDWNGRDFNDEALMPKIAKGIIKLHSTRSTRREVSKMRVDSEGNMYMEQPMLELVRDNKIHWDSLQGLPSLTQMAGNTKAWGEVYNKCNNLDMYCRALQRIQKDKHAADKKPFLKSSFDIGIPDTVHELQPPRRLLRGMSSHDIHSAIMFQVGLTKKGWGATPPEPGKKYILPLPEENFW